MEQHIPAGPLVLALIGAGRAGRSVAAAAVRAGHTVILEDVLPSNLRAALAEIETADYSGTLRLADTVEDAVRDADIAIDFVPDELESKLEILSMIDRMAPPRTVICTPTRALSINDLASCTYRADRCMAIELDSTDPFASATLVACSQTSPATLQVAQEFWQSIVQCLAVNLDPCACP